MGTILEKLSDTRIAASRSKLHIDAEIVLICCIGLFVSVVALTYGWFGANGIFVGN